jgi:hypothetical protein
VGRSDVDDCEFEAAMVADTVFGDSGSFVASLPLSASSLVVDMAIEVVDLCDLRLLLAFTDSWLSRRRFLVFSTITHGMSPSAPKIWI